MFINNHQGFYFDKLHVKAISCWTPWQPAHNLKIVNKRTASVHIEDFQVALTSYYDIIDPVEYDKGPSEWEMVKQQVNIMTRMGLHQKSLIYDKSPEQIPSMAILKDKTIASGKLRVSFLPKTKYGIVSIVFKYDGGESESESESDDNNKNNIPIENNNATKSFYIFDCISDDPEENENSQFRLRRYMDGNISEIKSTSKPISGIELGYSFNKLNTVTIDINNDEIKIKISQNGEAEHTVIEAKDDKLNHGRIGVGTSNASAVFTEIELMPPKFYMTEKDKSHVLENDVQEIFMPYLKSEVEKEKKTSIKFDSKAQDINNNSRDGNNINGNSNSNGNGNGKVHGLVNYDPISDSLGGAMKKCVGKVHQDQRIDYCKNEFNIKDEQHKCEGNFCTTCCEMNIPTSQKNNLYICEKLCKRSEMSVDNTHDYRSVCIHSTHQAHNVNTYCEESFSDNSEKVNCKLDLCNMCCVTMDMMRNTSYSFETVKSCLKECGGTYNHE